MDTPEPLKSRSSPPRIVVYTHDTFGMGHVRRCMNIIDQLSAARPDAAILMVTGSAAMGTLESRPANVDLVKLPTIAPTGGDEDRPPNLPIGTKAVVRMRRKLIATLMQTFEPDVLLVDNFALGARKELRPSLEMLKDTPTKVILGLRDIVDGPETIRERWPRDGVDTALEENYDHILVYGEERIFDLATEYALSPAIREKISYCGYVGRRAVRPVADADLAKLGIAAPFLLLTVGGGGDGLPLAQAFIRARSRFPEHSALIVTGPLMGPGPRSEVERLARGQADTEVIRYLPDLPRYMARADLVVSMAGYNTVVELMVNNCRSVIVPRNWRYGQYGQGTAAGVEMEQQMRAGNLERAGMATMVGPDNINETDLAEAINAALEKPRPGADVFRAAGAENAAEFILKTAAQREVGGSHV